MPLFVCFILVAIILPLKGQEIFEYRHVEGEKWHLNVTVEEEVFLNGEQISTVEILSKIAVEIRQGTGKDGLLWNRYSIAERDIGKEVYHWTSEQEALYARDRQGRISGLEAGSSVPKVRNVPVFPTTALSVGQEWTHEGSEVYNLAPAFNIPALLRVDFPVQYRYEGSAILDDRELDHFSLRYQHQWALDSQSQEAEDFLVYDWYPLEVVGNFSLSLWWDAQAGRSYATDGQFSYTYRMNDESLFHFQGRSKGRATYATSLDKEVLVKELERATKEIEGVKILPTEEGVLIALEDIYFIPDQALFVSGQQEKLLKIARVLARYPQRDILILGHTAKIDGASDGQVLSEQRAETVARYFLDGGVRQSHQIITRGMGSKVPIGENSTKEGRKKNRRVEIILLEN